MVHSSQHDICNRCNENILRVNRLIFFFFCVEIFFNKLDEKKF